MGWSAATGGLEAGAWILFGVLFAWQIPHFLSLAWLYRDDYARGGFKMLPSVDRSGSITGRLAFLCALALVPLCAAAGMAGIAGTLSVLAAQALNLAFALLAWHLLRRRSASAARRLFLASLLYLPLALGLMVADMGTSATAEDTVTRTAPARVATDSAALSLGPSEPHSL
jgi:heme O synthase-like polyprenyltransferase